MTKVVTIGSATLDVYLQSKAFKEVKSEKFLTGIGECIALGSKNSVDDIFVDTGGGATNCAVTFANLGINVSVMTRIGNDLFGGELKRVLKKRNVGLDLVQTDKKRITSYSTLMLLGTGQRSILVYRGASNALEFKGKPNVNWFYISSLGGNMALLAKILDYAKRKKIQVMYNPGSKELEMGLTKLKKYFKKLTVLNLNREEAAILCRTEYSDTEKIIKKMNGLAPYVVMTEGPAGASVFHDNNLYFAPSLGTKPKNTTGAGDAFGSGFCSGLILKDNVEYALKMGTLNADGVIRKMGAKNGLLKKIPTKAQLKRVKIKKEKV